MTVITVGNAVLRPFLALAFWGLACVIARYISRGMREGRLKSFLYKRIG